jgi:hypothetical protein
LTFSNSGALNYYPDVSSDKNYLLYTSTNSGHRQLKFLNLTTLESKQITDIDEGCGTFTPKWRS